MYYNKKTKLIFKFLRRKTIIYFYRIKKYIYKYNNVIIKIV